MCARALPNCSPCWIASLPTPEITAPSWHTDVVKYPRDIPPMWFLLAMGTEVALHYWSPGPRLIRYPWTISGLLLNLLGLRLTLNAVQRFRREQTGVRPFTPATTLVASGAYRFTRNPMYLGMVMMLSGAALMCGTSWPWVVPPLFWLLIDRRFVVREEQFLRERFGADYEVFCRKVRRWF